MTPTGTMTLTIAEFNRRAAAADAYLNRALAWTFGPAGVAFVVMMVCLLWEERVPEWVGNASVIVVMVFSLAGIVAGLVVEGRAVDRFGLLCPGCGMPLPGGRTNEHTVHVRNTGCCRKCAAPVLRDHPGAAEAAAREAALPRRTPHASAFTREDFDGRLARGRALATRRLTLFIVLGLGGMPAIAGVILLPLPRETKVSIMRWGMLIVPILMIGTVVGVKSIWRRVGMECPACRNDPLDGPDISVVRTGICPHCTALLIRPPA